MKNKKVKNKRITDTDVLMFLAKCDATIVLTWKDQKKLLNFFGVKKDSVPPGYGSTFISGIRVVFFQDGFAGLFSDRCSAHRRLAITRKALEHADEKIAREPQS